jgi:hypothetical protein
MGTVPTMERLSIMERDKPMRLLKEISFELDAAELMKGVRLVEDSDEAGEFKALVQWARKVAIPKAAYRECFVQSRGPDSVTIEGITFTSRLLRSHLDKVDRVFPFVCTCGREMDVADSPTGDFMKDAVLKEAIARFREDIGQRYLLTNISAMHPGSGDADVWPIQQQRDLFNLLGEAAVRIGVSLTDSCLMIPVKTVSGILFPTEHDFRTCQVCLREICPNRSAPLDENLWRSLHQGD